MAEGPPVVEGEELNAAARRLVRHALAEVEHLRQGTKRLRAVVKALHVCQQAGAEMPADLIDEVGRALAAFHVELDSVHEGSA